MLEWFTEQTQQAVEVGRSRTLNIGMLRRMQVEDIIYIVRKDKKKATKIHELLDIDKELNQAGKAFDDVKYSGLS